MRCVRWCVTPLDDPQQVSGFNIDAAKTRIVASAPALPEDSTSRAIRRSAPELEVMAQLFPQIAENEEGRNDPTAPVGSCDVLLDNCLPLFLVSKIGGNGDAKRSRRVFEQEEGDHRQGHAQARRTTCVVGFTHIEATIRLATQWHLDSLVGIPAWCPARLRAELHAVQVDNGENLRVKNGRFSLRPCAENRFRYTATIPAKHRPQIMLESSGKGDDLIKVMLVVLILWRDPLGHYTAGSSDGPAAWRRTLTPLAVLETEQCVHVLPENVHVSLADNHCYEPLETHFPSTISAESASHAVEILVDSFFGSMKGCSAAEAKAAIDSLSEALGD